MASAGDRRLRILFLSQRFLVPMDTGGKIRTGKLLQELKDLFDITLVSNVESPKDLPYLPEVEKLCAKFHGVPWQESRKYSLRFYLRVLRHSLSRYPITVRNDYCRGLESLLLKLSQENDYDLYICDFLQPSLNFRRLTRRPAILFEHNVESLILRRHYENARNPALRLFWKSQWRKMVRYETKACREFAATIAVSAIDKRLLQQEFSARDVRDIPTGIDTDFYAPVANAVSDPSLVFTGGMDWLPNEDGIAFFARDILPRIKSRIPGVKLTVVGKNPSRSLQNLLKKCPEIRAAGWVPDVRPYVHQAAVYVIPLRVGGGTRIKLFEAMAMGKAIVSTRVGAEGLPVTHGENIILADEPAEFADQVIDLLTRDSERRRLEEEARRFVVANFSWKKAAGAFAAICESVVTGDSGGKASTVGDSGMPAQTEH